MFNKNILKVYTPKKIVGKVICIIRSWFYSRLIDEGGGKISIESPFLKFKIKKDTNSKLIVKGKLSIEPYLFGTGTTTILLGQNATLSINGDFSVGNNVKLLASPGATLTIGGKFLESGSGITADTQILCNKKITIGRDFLCAWGVLISDSDWHTIGGQSHQVDVSIGDHVWIANNSSVLKGSVIGDNCIVAGQTKIINKTYAPNSLIAGIPAKVVKSDVEWCRDLK
ncbi:acyltransferase [Chryseobacterium taihuense]|uniref:Acetyltransferase (Isoleucine patch superfamily) n=1 Tax=Chryseobacterium taihuense TaxID=1141221 RepID=A0ABY0QSQ4_9FLAO|nr:hypothetical protein [Chryseobacterium taihuense]SDL77074.1 Acetyltransferase (isoleucine patch superfamily) [Chryseobacterium taihuense]